MLKTVLKLAIFYVLKSRASQARSGLTSNLSAVKENIAVMAESRAAIFKRNFNNELGRLGDSLIGFMFMLLAAVFSGLIGLMWLFAIAWDSPNRNTILSIALILPLLIGIAIYLYIRTSWKKEPLFDKTMTQIENDWQTFRYGLKEAADEFKD